jgi:hypothetical protein
MGTQEKAHDPQAGLSAHSREHIGITGRQCSFVSFAHVWRLLYISNIIEIWPMSTPVVSFSGCDGLKTDAEEVTHIRGFGFIGTLASGSHHLPHHLAIAEPLFDIFQPESMLAKDSTFESMPEQLCARST